LPLAAIWRRRHEIDGDVAAERVATEHWLLGAKEASLRCSYLMTMPVSRGTPVTKLLAKVVCLPR
jgi:hypothetical protein